VTTQRRVCECVPAQCVCVLLLLGCSYTDRLKFFFICSQTHTHTPTHSTLKKGRRPGNIIGIFIS